MRTSYVVHIETDEAAMEHGRIDHLEDALADWRPLIGPLRGRGRGVTVSLTMQAEGVDQAVSTALAVSSGHIQPIAVLAMPERLRDERLDQGAAAPPEVLTVAAAAEQLRISRQAVLRLVVLGKLPGQRTRQGWVVPAAAVRRRRREQPQAPRPPLPSPQES